MIKRLMFPAVAAVFAASLVTCGTAVAGPLENASEFQEKVVEEEEAQAENKMAGQAPGGDITWDESAGNSNAPAPSQADITDDRGN